jgi:arginine:ornithine antiporter / lysine permease
LKYLLLAALLYAPGALLFAIARREKGAALFKPFEWLLLATMLVLAAGAGMALYNGSLKL